MVNTLMIIGKPNVGKSTLFNLLLKKRKAITSGRQGTTRDINKQEYRINSDLSLELMDSGGIGKIEGDNGIYQDVILKKVLSNLENVDLILFLIDCDDYNSEDMEILAILRKHIEKVFLVVNKVDNEKKKLNSQNFYSLNIKNLFFISSAHNLGIDELKTGIIDFFKKYKTEDELKVKDKKKKGTKISLLGIPNTGKSTLLNQLVKEEKSIVSKIPNTTRDSIDAVFKYKNKNYTIIDTAGIRRKSKVKEDIEYYSFKRSYNSIEESDIVLLMLDLEKKELSKQDKKIAALIIDKKKPVIMVYNKLDLLKDKKEIKIIEDRTRFLFPVLNFAPIIFISALKGKGIERLFECIENVLEQNKQRCSTHTLNLAFREWILKYPPPLTSKKRKMKLKYITQVSAEPVQFVMFVNNLLELKESYKNYIINKIREDLGFKNVPIFLKVKDNREKAILK